MTTHNSPAPAAPAAHTAEAIAHEISATQRALREHHDRKTALAAERAKAVQRADGPAMVAVNSAISTIRSHAS